MPTRSAGSRSGVNWMRENCRSSTCPSVFTASVLARPGTPSTSRWPRQSSATIIRSTRERWPTMTFLISATAAWTWSDSSRTVSFSRVTSIWAWDIDRKTLLQGARNSYVSPYRPPLSTPRSDGRLPRAAEGPRAGANMGSREGCSLERMAAGRRAPGIGDSARLGRRHRWRCGLHGQPGHHLEAAARRRSLVGGPRPRRFGLDGRARPHGVGAPVGSIPSLRLVSRHRAGGPVRHGSHGDRARAAAPGTLAGQDRQRLRGVCGRRAPGRRRLAAPLAVPRLRPARPLRDPVRPHRSRRAPGHRPARLEGRRHDAAGAGADGGPLRHRPPGAPGRRRQHGRGAGAGAGRPLRDGRPLPPAALPPPARPPRVPLVRAAVGGVRALHAVPHAVEVRDRPVPSRG